MPGPRDARFYAGTDKRCEPFWSCWMDPEQDDTREPQWTFALDGNLPEAFIKSQDDTLFNLGEIQSVVVFRSGEVRSSPKHIVAVFTKRLHH